jgi:hypothetical protein
VVLFVFQYLGLGIGEVAQLHRPDPGRGQLSGGVGGYQG